MYPVDLKLILSAVFIFVGSTVFYISSLISGHSIYRDLPHNLSTIVTTIVGVLLFIFSPLCFIVLFPGLFGLNIIPFTERIFVINLHKVIFGSVLWPYFAAAIGFGLIFGALSAIEFREMVLTWMRKRSGLRYPIVTYGLTWDDLLKKVKPGGEISVKVEGRTITGNLITYSVKHEPKQIILQGYSIKHDCLPTGVEVTRENDELLITEFAEIKEIAVPSKSLNIQGKFINYSAQSFYISLTAMGFIFLALSFDGTQDFLGGYQYNSLANMYTALGFISVLLAVAFSIGSIRLLRQGFQNFYSALVLCPANLLVQSVLLILITFLGAHFAHYDLPVSFVSVMACGGILFFYFKFFNDRLRLTLLFDNISNQFPKKSHLLKMIDFVYKNLDFANMKLCISAHGPALSQQEQDLYVDIEKINHMIQEFTAERCNCYLKGEECNIILTLKWYLTRDD